MNLLSYIFHWTTGASLHRHQYEKFFRKIFPEEYLTFLYQFIDYIEYDFQQQKVTNP